MTEKIYRIKPLVWVQPYPETTPEIWRSACGYFVQLYKGMWIWDEPNSDEYSFNSCTSLEDGKAKCEAHRIERLERDLEVVG